MVSKTSSVRSIRLPNTTWAWLESQAEKRGVKVNALVTGLLDPGRPQVAPKWETKSPPLPRATRDLEPPATNPAPAETMRKPPVPYGSRLKVAAQPKKGKAK